MNEINKCDSKVDSMMNGTVIPDSLLVTLLLMKKVEVAPWPNTGSSLAAHQASVIA